MDVMLAGLARGRDEAEDGGEDEEEGTQIESLKRWRSSRGEARLS